MLRSVGTLNRPAILRPAGDLLQSGRQIVLVIETVVREPVEPRAEAAGQELAVAVDAVGAAPAGLDVRMRHEQLPPPFLDLAERDLAAQELIVTGIGRHQRALERGERRGDGRGGDLAVGDVEELPVGLVPGELLDELVQVLGHLVGVLDRNERLLLERGRPAVPEEATRPPHQVGQAHAVEGERPAGDAHRRRLPSVKASSCRWQVEHETVVGARRGADRRTAGDPARRTPRVSGLSGGSSKRPKTNGAEKPCSGVGSGEIPTAPLEEEDQPGGREDRRRCQGPVHPRVSGDARSRSRRAPRDSPRPCGSGS
jgi:hypothetical protein